MPRFLDGFLSLSKPVNRTGGEAQEETKEGVVGEHVSELALSMDDSELIELKRKWEQKWDSSKVKKDVEAKQKENEKYWLGDHYTSAQKQANKRDAVDNLIFEALETALPVYTRQIAQPVIKTLGDPNAQAFAKKVEDRITDLADTIRLRLKVKKAVRNWALYFLGVLKFGWSVEKNEITVQAVRPQQLILEPDAMTDECEYEGAYIGFYRTETASDLAERFPKKAEEIKKLVGKESLGTKLRYVEWWTADYVFWTLNEEVLAKAKNPHWNYDQTVTSMAVDPNTGEAQEFQSVAKGSNHFSQRKIPVATLSIFNLGKGPYDDTNQIEQVLPVQDVVNKRIRQIDKNADGTNGGAIVSGDHFSPEQASAVGDALRKGKTIRVPNGDVNRAYKRDMAPALPAFIYQNLQDARQEIRSIFGTTGLSPQGIKGEETVRGKILVKGSDTDRAALIVDHIEQLYDYVFNWFVQMMMVYYDTPVQISRTQGVDTISSAEFVYPLVVSVKEGSLIPKDRLTLRNEAVDLWAAGAIDPLTLAERLEVPNPQEYVQRLIMWKTNPLSLLQGGAPLEAQAQQQLQPQEQTVEPILNQVPIQ